MALNWQAPSGSNFADTFYAYLKVMEGPAPGTGDIFHSLLVNGNPTIGVGFDLVAGGTTVQNAVLEGLGLSSAIVEATPSEIAAYTAGSWQAIEYSYVTQSKGPGSN